MLDNTQGAITILESAIEGAQEAVGSALTPAIRTAAEAVTPLISRFTLWAQQNPQIIQGVVGIIAVLTGLAVAVTGVAVAFAAWSMITAQIGMFKAGMAAVRAGMLATEVASLGMTARMGAAFATLQARIAGLTFSSMAASIGTAFTSIGAAIRTATTAAMGFVATPLGAALTAIALAAYLVYSNWDRLAPVFKNIADTFINSLTPIGPAVTAAISSIQNAFKSLGDTGIGDTLIKGILAIVNVAASVAATLVNIFAQAVIAIANLFKNLGDVVSNILEGKFVEAGKSAANLVTDAVTDTLSTVKALKTLGDIPANTQKSLEIFEEQTRLKERGTVSERIAASVAQTSSVSSKIQGAANQTPNTPSVDFSQFRQAYRQKEIASNADAIFARVSKSTSSANEIPQSPIQPVQQVAQPVQQVTPERQRAYLEAAIRAEAGQLKYENPQLSENQAYELTQRKYQQAQPQIQPVQQQESQVQTTSAREQLQSLQAITNSQQAYQNLLRQQSTSWQPPQSNQPVAKVETAKPAEQTQSASQIQNQSQLQTLQAITNSQQAYQNFLKQQSSSWQKPQPIQQTQSATPIQQPTPQPQPAQKPAEQKPVDTQPLQNKFNEAAQSANNLTQAIQPAAQAQQQIPQATRNIQSALQTLPQSVQPVQEAVGQLGTVATSASSVVGQLGTASTMASSMVGQLGTVSATSASSVGQLGTAAQMAADSVGQLGTAAMTAASSVGQLGTAAQMAADAVGQLGTAAAGAASGVGQLGTAAAGASGSVGLLGSAASAAASALMSAASSIASAAASAASAAASASAAAASAGGGGVAANYKGGIYNKGAFLTWFAEKSPEAAIPLDKSQRAINLWSQAGQMLGVLPNESKSVLPTSKPSADSTRRGVLNFERAKEYRAKQIYNSIVNQSNSQIHNTISTQDSALSNLASTVSNISNVQNSVQNLQAAQFDELGNIIGLNGAAGNVITKCDNDKIKQVKQAAQLKEFSAGKISPRKFDRLFQIALERFKKLKVPESASQQNEKLPTPIFLTEQQRYRSEDITKEKTLERVANSRSYKAIQNAMKVSNSTPTTSNSVPATTNPKSASILNSGDLKTSIPTDLTGGLFSRLGIGNINLGGIMGVDLGNILGGLFGKPDVTNVDILNPTPTFPRQQNSQPPIIDSPILTTLSKTNSIVERISTSDSVPTTTNSKPSGSILDRGELNTKLPTDITGGLFSRLGLGNINLGGIMGVDLGNILGGLFNFDFKNIFGGISDKIFGGGQSKTNSPAEKIMNLSSTFSNLTQSFVTPINSALSSPQPIEPLESVQTAETSNDYSTLFQPTFNIEVKVSLSGSDVDAKAVGEQIATFTRKSFEKEFAEFMHEKSRRGYV